MDAHAPLSAELSALAIAAKRRAVRRDPAAPRLLEIDLERERARFSRSLTPTQARAWVEEVRGELGPSSELLRLEEDAERAEAESRQGRGGAAG